MKLSYEPALEMSISPETNVLAGAIRAKERVRVRKFIVWRNFQFKQIESNSLTTADRVCPKN